MYYIDEYNSKAISNNPPEKKKLVEKLEKVNKEIKQEQLDAFWKLMGITISENFDTVKDILSRYGYNVVNEQDAAVAISELWEKPNWLDFVKEISILIESTIDEKLVENLLPQMDESSFVAALIGAIGTVASGTLGLVSNKQQKDIAKENAKAQMISAITSMNAEREKAQAERAKAKSQESKMMYWIVGLLIVIIGVIITIVIIKRNKKDKQ